MVTIPPGEKILQGVILIKIWFLMALMAYPNMNAIHYKGYGGFKSQEECNEKGIIVENMITQTEMNRGTAAFFVETFCLEMYAFPSQWDAPRKAPVNPSEFGA
jgi:hypothetical protein